jgi:hypothetical protein
MAEIKHLAAHAQGTQAAASTPPSEPPAAPSGPRDVETALTVQKGASEALGNAGEPPAAPGVPPAAPGDGQYSVEPEES